MEMRDIATSALTRESSPSDAPAASRLPALWRRLKQVRPSHLLVGFGSGLILIGLAATAALIWQMRVAIVDTTVEELSRLNLVLVSQMARTVQNTDLLLQTTAETYQRREAARDLDPQEMHILMRERVTAMHGLIRGHAIAGPDGSLRHSASRYPAGPLNPSDRSYFQVHRENPFAGLYISEPMASRNNGEWGIYISRRLNDPQGGFAGIVFAGIDPGLLAEQFSALKLGAGSSVSLLRNDGLILARSLNSPLGGQSVAGYGLFRDLRPGTDGLHGREAAPPLGRGPRIYSGRYLPDLPLAIIISLPEDAVLVDWRRFALFASIAAAMATLTMTLLIGGLVRQIRRQEDTAAALEKSRRSLEMAQAVGHVGSWESSLRDGVQEWSAETFRIFGVDKAGWGGTIRDFLALVHPDDRAAVRAATVTTIDHGLPYSIDHRVCRPDGAVRWVHVQAEMIRDSTGGPVRLVGTVRDVTEETLAAHALRVSETRLRDYVQTASDGYWETGLDHRYTFITSRIHSEGFDHQTLLGLRRHDLGADTEREPEKWAAHAATLDRHEPFQDFVYLTKIRGDTAYLSVSGKPVFDERGEFQGYRGTTRDVTEKIIAEGKLREAKVAAETASAAKSAFLANMSHELRTPLNAIIGFAEALNQGYFGSLNAKQSEYLRDIRASGNHLLLLINDVLDVAKIEAGKLDLDRESLNIADEIEACLRLVRPKAGDSRINLVATLPPDLTLYAADRRAIRQVLLNLLSNAVKFTPKGGEVTIEARNEPDGGIRISVTDTGIGIAPKDLPRVIVPFGALGRNVDFVRQNEGTGLGLPLSKSLVEMHGGTLEMQSELGRGTTAIVHLPASPAAA